MNTTIHHQTETCCHRRKQGSGKPEGATGRAHTTRPPVSSFLYSVGSYRIVSPHGHVSKAVSRMFCFVLSVRYHPLGKNIARTMLDFLIDPCDVFARDPDAEHADAANDELHQTDGGKTTNGHAEEV